MALALVALGTTGATPVGRLDVTVERLRSTKGVLRVCLTTEATRFPSCVGDANAVRLQVPATQTHFSLPGLRYGTYALAVIHDENDNRRLDKLAGIPREGFGFSRDPAMRFGPPRFAAARFEVGHETESERVKMRYMF